MYLCNALVSSMINGIKVRNCVIFAIVLLGLFFYYICEHSIITLLK